MSTDHNRVVVAMSGGVDSSVAALLLHRQGHDLMGVSMQVWDYRNNGGCKSRATCCAPDDFTDARRVAGSIGIPYYVFDLEKVFREQVIDNFVNRYQNGLTPNPCVDCNNKVKFRELRSRAQTIGCGAVATGHYARITKDDAGYHLLRGVDRKKDQSYFVYGLSQAELSQTLFPVGGYTKPEVRELAREVGLITADKPESQDICFVSGKVSDFVRKVGGKVASGQIVTRDGTVVSEHDGIQQFTVGQRRGLGIGGAEQPLYVLEIDAATNRVVVGERSELERAEFSVEELSWVAPGMKERVARGETLHVIAQLRHRHAGVPVHATRREDGDLSVRFIDEWAPVAPGQAAVFYDLKNEEVLGGGRISS